MKTSLLSLLFLFAFIFPSALFSQDTCRLSTGSYDQAFVDNCLANCSMCRAIKIEGNPVNLLGKWDLRSFGNVHIVIAPGARLEFTMSDTLVLTAGSSITVLTGTTPIPNGMLTASGLNNDVVVIIKGTRWITVAELMAITPTNGVLPVVLHSFEGYIQKQTITLSWQTATELNNAKFVIQTSPEGEIFNNIGEIAGAGTTTEPHNYSFTHQTPSAGANYYRLKQVDFDGTFAYSKVLAIHAPGSNDIFAFPNPAKDKITLQYDYSKGEGSIQLFDALGRRLKTNIGGYAGNYEVVLPEGLAKGTYWLKVERAGKVQTVPVVKE